MKPANVFQVEVKTTLLNRHGLLMKVGFALLIGIPLVFISILFVSFFGAAIGIVRRRKDGHLGHLRILPIPLWVTYVDMVLAGAVVDMVQLMPMIALYLLTHGQIINGVLLFSLFGLLLFASFLFNLLGRP